MRKCALNGPSHSLVGWEMRAFGIDRGMSGWEDGDLNACFEELCTHNIYLALHVLGVRTPRCVEWKLLCTSMMFHSVNYLITGAWTRIHTRTRDTNELKKEKHHIISRILMLFE